MTVDPHSLHGLIKNAKIRLPLVRNLRFIDVPGLYKGDQYGHGVAEEGLAKTYGAYDSLAIVFPPNGNSTDVTTALQRAWSAHLRQQILDGTVHFVAFNPLDKLDDLQTLEEQTREDRHLLIESAVEEKTESQLDYLRKYLGTDRSVGIASKILKLSDDERDSRLQLLMDSITPITANVLVSNPDPDIRHVEAVVQVFVDFTSSRWCRNVKSSYETALQQLSSVARILHSFSLIDSPTTIREVLEHVKMRAEQVRLPSSLLVPCRLLIPRHNVHLRSTRKLP
jgi:hypothetical protein